MIPFTIKSLEMNETEGLNLRLSAYTRDRERAKGLFLSAQHAVSSQIEGDIAEFGVYGGETAAILAAAIMYFEEYTSLKNKIMKGLEKKKILHLFDSFRGYPQFDTEVDKDSYAYRSGRFYPGGHAGAGMTPEEFEEKATRGAKELIGGGRVKVHGGYFSETLKAFDPSTKLSLVHLDCDLYQSSVEALDFIFANDMMTQGSVLFMDGFICNKASNGFGMRRAWREVREKYDVDAEDCGEVGLGCRKFYIHTDGT